MTAGISRSAIVSIVFSHDSPTFFCVPKSLSPDRVRDLIGDLDELALSEVAVFVFGVSVVLEHLQDDFTPS